MHFTQGCTVASLVEIGRRVLEKIYFVDIFELFHNYLSFEKGVAFHLYKLEYPLPKDDFCQVLFKLVQRFLRRFLNSVHVFFLFRNYLPLGKGMVLHLNKLESPLPKDAFCQVLVKIDLVVLEKLKIGKVYRQTDRRTDRQMTGNQKRYDHFFRGGQIWHLPYLAL